jgi:hypothetical protein
MLYKLFETAHVVRLKAHRSRALKSALSRGNDHPLPIRSNLERSELLDLAGLQCNVRDVKAWKFPSLKGNKLDGIVLPRQMIEGTLQRSLCRICLRDPKAFSGVRAVHRQEVPAHPANHGVENRR